MDRNETAPKIVREVILHTLLSDTILVSICDLKCIRCEWITEYDGTDDAVFHTARGILYTRDLLDAWVYETTVGGSTFREAYNSVRKFAGAALSLMPTRRAGLFYNRRTENEAF